MQIQREILSRGSPIQLGLPARFTVEKISLPSRAGNLRIAHLSDTHLRPGWPSALDRLIQIVKSSEPNLICFTGDWIDDKFDPRPSSAACRRFAESLCAIAPTVTCLGNHDGDLFAPILIDAGVITLINERVVHIINNQEIELIAGAGVGRIDHDSKFFEEIPPRDHRLRIGLSHYPDSIPFWKNIAPDVLLTGHTHGGQICMPGERPIITHDSLHKSKSRGFFQHDGIWMNVTRGIGWTSFPLRLFAPSEITIVDFTTDFTSPASAEPSPGSR